VACRHSRSNDARGATEAKALTLKGRQADGCSPGNAEGIFRIPLTMNQSKEKETAQLGLDVLSRLGIVWSEMTEDVGRAEHPHRMRCLLIELAKPEARSKNDGSPSR
jgi:hypothetical protein